MKRLAAMITVGVLTAYGCDPWITRAVAQDTPQADPSSDAYARAVSSAVADFEAGRFQQALASFQQAHSLQPSARTWRGIGLASYSLQDFVHARRAFERALIDPRRPLAEAQRAEVEGLLRETAQHTGHFELHVHPPDARIEVDGTLVSERELVLALGEHRLVVSAAGHASERRTLEVRGAEVSSLSIVLTPSATPQSSPQPHEAPEPLPTTHAAETQPADTTQLARTPPTHSPQRDADTGRLWPWIVLGATPLLATAAGVVWWSGLEERNAVEAQCQVDLCTREDADRRADAAHLGRYETATTLLLGASLVTAVTGVTLLLLSGSRAPQPDTLTLRAGPTGLQLDGHF